MARARVYPPAVKQGIITEFSESQLKGLGDLTGQVALADGKHHGLYRWGSLVPIASLYDSRNWLYVADYESNGSIAAIVNLNGSGVVTVLKLTMTKV